MKHPAHHIFAFTPTTLREWCEQRAMAPFRADQILDWVYRKGVIDPSQMLNLSKRDRDILTAEVTFLSGDTVAHRAASDGTQKLLIEWKDYSGSDEATEARSDEGPCERTDAAPDEPEAPARDASSRCEPEAQAKDSSPRHEPEAQARVLPEPQASAPGIRAAPTAADSAPPSLQSLSILNNSSHSHSPPPGDPTRQTECVMIPSESATKRHSDEATKGSPLPNRQLRASRPPSLQASSPHASGLTPQASSTPRRTACISSQVGCPVGCRFCASGLGGLDANLSAGRIVEQVWRLNFQLRPPLDDTPAALDPSPLEGEFRGGRVSDVHSTSGLRPQASSPSAPPRLRASAPPPRISNIVFMGMGEPLANFAAVKHAVQTLAAPWGMGISARKITISTVGLPQAIHRLAEQLDLPITLALSLHAPTDELRRELIPWSNYTTIAELIEACDAWFKKTGREITLEYILLGGVNDQPQHAEELAKVAKRLRSNVNLIRYNEVRGIPYNRPATDDVRRFQDILRERGVNTHIRASRGRDIEAACGQLRHEKATSSETART